jgi:hypothetical protein
VRDGGGGLGNEGQSLLMLSNGLLSHVLSVFLQCGSVS